MHSRRLPTGISDFKKIRETESYYVDKTDIFYKMIRDSDYFLLSRPRRFGKSLIVSTLKYLFEGHESLFKGLAIHKQWDWSQENIHPVVRLSFGGEYAHPEAIERSILKQLSHVEETYELKVPSTPDSIAQERLRDVLFRLHKKTGQRVVVLVDEYDKPILDVIANTESRQLIEPS